MAVLRNIQIEDIEYTGHGVGRTTEGRVVFVEDALPGEVVDARVTKAKKRYAFAYPVERHVISPRRVEPFCSHFYHCGGCKWQYLPYEEQVKYKGEFVRQILTRIGKLSDPPVEPPLPCLETRYYRNKMEFSFTTGRWLTDDEVKRGAPVDDRRALGLHVRKRYDKILHIDHCHLQRTNELRNGVYEIAIDHDLPFFDPVSKQGYLRGLIIRTSLLGETMIVLVLGRRDSAAEGPFLDAIRRRFPWITSGYVTYNDKRNDAVGGRDTEHRFGTVAIRERCESLVLAIHPKSFYQTNPLQAERLYSLIRDWAGLTGSETVYDLYSGIGSIGLFLASDAARVIGIETVPEAVDNAVENAEANGVTNCEFIVGRVEERFGDRLVREFGQPDLVVIDPPRAGLKPAVVDALRLVRSPRLLYVSCNPSTQARDIAALSDVYRTRRIRPVDMFPQTYHIETIAELNVRADD